MRLERKQNDVSIHEVREWELIFYEVHYDLAITQHVQQKDTITTKYPPLQKQEEKNVVENTSSLKFPHSSWYRR